MDAKEVVQLVPDLPEGQRVLLTSMLWRWWSRRNKVNAGETEGVHIVTPKLGLTFQFRGAQTHAEQRQANNTLL